MKTIGAKSTTIDPDIKISEVDDYQAPPKKQKTHD